ncbi:unnamed protein product [Dovyalis caffra]|uniref:MLO-like protein n=1 Tax=Dovyalis caffra TaxID=77055 RepID=A0AAV1S0X7_9ROSI|nr:unnamed protein product [Dovyalis caffra]
MAGAVKARSLEETPTWAVAVWLTRRHKRALYEALEKVKSELMLLGFISLLLTVGQGPISDICVPKSDKVALVSADGITQLHIFIFVLAVFHVLSCILTLALSRAKMRKWKKWEMETTTSDYQLSHDPERFRFARDTSFGRRHLNSWTRSSILLWIQALLLQFESNNYIRGGNQDLSRVCFFRQFFRSVLKVDYLTLRHGFVMAHLAPQSQTKFNFQTYIKRSLEEDFKVVVGIRLVFLSMAAFHPADCYLVGEYKATGCYNPDGSKHSRERAGCARYLHNAFQFAFFAWTWYEFGLKSCFHEYPEDLILRTVMGVVIQFLCSYVTLPLYALVTQMGSTMRPTIFNERLAKGLRNWHHTARKHIKQNRHSGTVTPTTSAPGTPRHAMSPVHLLRNNRGEPDGIQASSRKSDAEDGGRKTDSSGSYKHTKHGVEEEDRCS